LIVKDRNKKQNWAKLWTF